MAFPTTGILDDFNRADGGLGSNWTTDPWNYGEDAPRIVSNQVAENSSTADSSAYWSAATFGPDSEAYITLAASSGAGSLTLGVRITNPDSANLTAYYAEVIFTATPDRWRIYRIVNNAYTQIGSTVNQNVSAGEKVGLEAIGTAIAFKHYTGGSWVDRVTATDGNVTGAGYITAVRAVEPTDRLDDFGGGTVVVAGGPTVKKLAALGVG